MKILEEILKIFRNILSNIISFFGHSSNYKDRTKTEPNSETTQPATELSPKEPVTAKDNHQPPPPIKSKSSQDASLPHVPPTHTTPTIKPSSKTTRPQSVNSEIDCVLVDIKNFKDGLRPLSKNEKLYLSHKLIRDKSNRQQKFDEIKDGGKKILNIKNICDKYLPSDETVREKINNFHEIWNNILLLTEKSEINNLIKINKKLDAHRTTIIACLNCIANALQSSKDNPIDSKVTLIPSEQQFLAKNAQKENYVKINSLPSTDSTIQVLSEYPKLPDTQTRTLMKIKKDLITQKADSIKPKKIFLKEKPKLTEELGKVPRFKKVLSIFSKKATQKRYEKFGSKTLSIKP